MKKFVCTICGYIHEGDAPPKECPICKASADKFQELTETLNKLQSKRELAYFPIGECLFVLLISKKSGDNDSLTVFLLSLCIVFFVFSFFI